MPCRLACFIVILGSALSIAASSQAAESGDVKALLSDMDEAWADVRDYTVNIDKTERMIDGRVLRQSVFMKFRRPDHYYFRVDAGYGEGSELIFPKSREERVALAHPGGAKGRLVKFLNKIGLLRKLAPTEFSLEDPNIIRDQHQTVLESNLGYTIGMITRAVRTALEREEGEVKLVLDCGRAGQCAQRIDLDLPADRGSFHTVGPGEDLWSIARRFDMPMYIIWYNNPDMRGPDDLRPGQRLFIPGYYAASGRIWIPEGSGLPEKIEIFDRDGRLYERYVYSDLRTNIGLTDLDFEVANDAYDF